MDNSYDVVIIGAGAAGLMCAIEAGKRGRSVLLIDHAKKPAEKIRISGGGRCNFTNLHASPGNYLSRNNRFCISALRRYTQYDFIELVEHYGIAYHEKTLGQLFCDESAKQIISMLLNECDKASVTVQLETAVKNVARVQNTFEVNTDKGRYICSSLVIATGGKSIPKMGATGFGYDIAHQFGLNVEPFRAGLVPFTFEGDMLHYVRELAGLSLEVIAKCNNNSFREAMLFTHRGLSGPAMLQISSYWQEGEEVIVNLAPDVDVLEMLYSQPRQKPLQLLTSLLPKRLASSICNEGEYYVKIAEMSKVKLRSLAQRVNAWNISPSGTEGFRTAEVTLGGVDTDELSPKTFEARSVKGLYFIGEVVDVTGHLGGFNFQWAWSSGYVAGQYV